MMNQCLICGATVQPFISFGRMPIANGFLEPSQFMEEYFFDLKVAHCSKCQMVQLLDLVDRERMFHENYAFFSSTSERMAGHFKAFADGVKKDYLTSPDARVVEIGSNDGVMLQHFAAQGICHLGVEPSRNVAEAAAKRGIKTICKFFDRNVAEEIRDMQGRADVILAANVMCHIPYIHSVIQGIRELLKPNGVFIFEDPYLGDIIEKTAYDQIYDEHAFYFSVTSLSYLFQLYGMELIDVMPQRSHGGSMRCTAAHTGAKVVSPTVSQQIVKEKNMGLHMPETYDRLRQNIERSRTDLMGMLIDLKKQGRRVLGYGATSKSTTVTNYCGITPQLVEFICDTTPVKQGKFSPGAHIPVRPHRDFVDNYPDCALLFAWNHAEEIMEKEAPFLADGGKWILYVPKVTLME